MMCFLFIGMQPLRAQAGKIQIETSPSRDLLSEFVLVSKSMYSDFLQKFVKRACS